MPFSVVECHVWSVVSSMANRPERLTFNVNLYHDVSTSNAWPMVHLLQICIASKRCTVSYIRQLCHHLPSPIQVEAATVATDLCPWLPKVSACLGRSACLGGNERAVCASMYKYYTYCRACSRARCFAKESHLVLLIFMHLASP